MTNHVNNQISVLSTDMTQLTLTVKMTAAQFVKTLIIVNNSPIQDYNHLDGHVQPTFRTY